MFMREGFTEFSMYILLLKAIFPFFPHTLDSNSGFPLFRVETCSYCKLLLLEYYPNLTAMAYMIKGNGCVRRDKFLCCMLFFAFLALTVHKTQLLFTTD